ncbi:MAG TPA: Rne/Rng family ribonuclease [Xanthobacteraceae bacterium]|nr:Rne/Rng family ribonuclease [Xanthobacteraceae bacterium]
MPNKMLIDASHPEETRVVVLRGNRVEEFDFESASRRQLRGNIYLAKVTRVEPSLQACFVDYGGNRHGFLAFGEIHPDYYQIPVADRQRLIAEEERAAREAEEHPRGRGRARAAPPAPTVSEPAPAGEHPEDHGDDHAELNEHGAPEPVAAEGEAVAESEALAQQDVMAEATAPVVAEVTPDSESPSTVPAETPHAEAQAEEDIVEQVGGDAFEEVPTRQPRRHRSYKIQEVIKRRQVMLVQVVKEERGTKGAALTTYLSLAGRYAVLMPNTARGGGISRKITSALDRKRLKDLVEDLEVPEGMGVILRTAGASRTKAEIKRDFEYLIRLWETVRELTLKSNAPALVYEEGSLVKRAIRDLYNKDIDEVIVAGDEAYKEAKEFMRMLTPSHAKNVQPYRDTQPIFVRHGIEHQLDAMFSPIVQLKSGGYIVINPTEALVSIDVNSGRATREHHIEDTALKTNSEAAEEIARQLRLRDLAGLIVIDFIDMDEKRNNRNVERKLKDALKHDRARIQVGSISHFGLMEMSRQRIRTGVLESSTVSCPVCGGTGHVRATSSVTLQLLRSIEDQLLKVASHDLIVRTRPDTALYVLNHKRAHLHQLEDRFGVAILIQSDTTLAGQQYFALDKGPLSRREPAPATRVAPDSVAPIHDEPEEEIAETEVEAAETGGEEETAPPSQPMHEGGEQQPGEDGHRRRRRRRRGRRGRGGEHGQERGPREPHTSEPRGQPYPAEAQPFENYGEAETFADAETGGRPPEAPRFDQPRGPDQPGGDGPRRRRRGRRGGRRNRNRIEGGREPGGEPRPFETNFAAAPEQEFEPGRELEPQPAPHRPAPPVDEPVARPAPVEEPPAAQPRRSTVREPAPFVSFDHGAPIAPSAPLAPQPAAAPVERNEPEDSNQPRRSGWWRKR